jgi:oxygen-independent coproporphyrinogen-3 oxidase
LFPLHLLKSFLSLVGTDGSASNVSEIALEANPEDIEKSSLESWRNIGVNRLIIGVQSFRDEVLSGLGRLHSASTAKAAVRAARSTGIEHISVDLAFDGLIRTADVWQAELNQLVEYADPDHISLYQIDREASQRGTLRQFWQMAKSKLGSSKYIRYHLNSWAKPESFSHYNIAVSSGADYLGLGAGAVGMRRVGDKLLETRGVLPVQRYLEQMPSERYTRKRLTGMDLLLDRVTRGLQTVLGVEVDRLAERFALGETGGDAAGELAQLFERLATEGVLSSQDGRYFLPPRQLDRADRVCRLIGSRVSESHRT